MLDLLGNKHYQLHEAAKIGATDSLKILLQSNSVDVNQKDNNACAPLQYAAENGHTETVKCLIKQNANLDTKDKEGETPLHKSVKNSHCEIVELLLKNGADANAYDVKRWTPLLLAIHEQVKPEVVETLIKTYKSINNKCNVNFKDKDGNSPLYWAVQKLTSASVELLIKSGAQVNDNTNQKNQMPIHNAAYHGRYMVVPILMNNEAKVNEKDKLGMTPLHYATQSRCIKTVEDLIKWGAQINSKDNNGQTPLEIADREDKRMNELLSSPFQIPEPIYINRIDKYESLLHKAVRENDKNEVEKLMHNDIKVVNVQNSEKHTSLLLASIKGYYDIVEVLVLGGADTKIPDEYGNTPLHRSAEEGHLDVVKVLLKDKSLVNVTNKISMTPLHWAAVCGHVNIIEELINNKADIEAKDKFGNTAVHKAAQRFNASALRALLKFKCDYKAKNNFEVQALHYAAHLGNRNIIQELLAAGADVNCTDCIGQTPLHFAKQRGDKHTVELLINRGANNNLKDHFNRLPSSTYKYHTTLE